MKGIDPTLGLYAAYAYADAGLPDQVRSVREYMRGDLGVDLFDVAMLSSSTRSWTSSQMFPFFPMLSQGWSLLRVCGAKLDEGLAEAHNHLLPGLWTTLDAVGSGIVELALRAGRVR
jgi:hypothetical protein